MKPDLKLIENTGSQLEAEMLEFDLPPQQQEMPFAVVEGEPVTQLPRDLYIPPDALQVFLEAFEGPLDLLLYLIRRQNLDILDIPIAEITRQYMKYIEVMSELQLELAGEYLLMAAMLAEIKSRMLLPRPSTPEGGEEEDPRAELVRRLQEYERFKKAAEDIDLLPRMERDHLPTSIELVERKVVRILPQVSLQEMLLALKDVMQRAEMFAHHQVHKDKLSVRQRMSDILSTLRSTAFVEFTQMFRVEEGRMGVTVTFSAILELMKEGLIEIVQAEPYAPLHIRPSSGTRHLTVVSDQDRAESSADAENEAALAQPAQPDENDIDDEDDVLIDELPDEEVSDSGQAAESTIETGDAPVAQEAEALDTSVEASEVVDLQSAQALEEAVLDDSSETDVPSVAATAEAVLDESVSEPFDAPVAQETEALDASADAIEIVDLQYAETPEEAVSDTSSETGAAIEAAEEAVLDESVTEAFDAPVAQETEELDTSVDASEIVDLQYAEMPEEAVSDTSSETGAAIEAAEEAVLDESVTEAFHAPVAQETEALDVAVDTSEVADLQSAEALQEPDAHGSSDNDAALLEATEAAAEDGELAVIAVEVDADTNVADDALNDGSTESMEAAEIVDAHDVGEDEVAPVADDGAFDSQDASREMSDTAAVSAGDAELDSQSLDEPESTATDIEDEPQEAETRATPDTTHGDADESDPDKRG